MIFLLLVLSSIAFAAKTEISSSDGKQFNISQIERSILVKHSEGRLNIVEIDNGGSTDISSSVYPSQILLTYFKDGEFNNLAATFDLGPVVKLKSAILKDRKTIIFTAEVKNLELKSSLKKFSIDISDLLKKSSRPEITAGEFETQVITAKVVLSEI